MQEETLTPPDTIMVKQQLLKQRSAISDAQQELSMNAYAGSPLETPVAAAGAKRAGGGGGGVTFAGVPETPAATRPGGELVRDILLYSSPPLTYVAAAAGVLALALAWFVLRGAHGLTLLSALSYLLLADIALNFFRSLVSKQWHDSSGWAGSEWAAALADRAAAAVAALARLHDAYLRCQDPAVTLRVAGGLWALAVMGRYLSIWSLAALGFAAAFTLPAAYASHREAVLRAWASATRGAASRWAALGLSRRQQALLLLLLLGSLWLRSGWATRCVALLVGALAVRCQLKPAEVERIIAIAEPYTQSVRKRASRMSLYAQDFAMRTAGGKAHAR